MQVVVAGSTGFVGQAVVRRALEEGHQVFPLVQDQREAAFDPEAITRQQLVPLPFGAPADVLHAGFGLGPGAWIINVAGLQREHPHQDPQAVHRTIATAMVELAQENEAARLVHFGPLLTTDDAFTRTKAAMEEGVRGAGVPWTIVRSAPVYGPGDALLDEVGAWMSRSPLIPRFLEEVPLQPVHVGDVADVLLRADPGPHAIGGERWLWGELLAAAAEAAGKRLWGPRLQPETMLWLARRLGHRAFFAPLVPFTEAGWHRHQRGYTVEDNALQRLLGRAPMDVATYLRAEWPYRA